jgi:ABC-type phosphate transport system permease subunit
LAVALCKLFPTISGIDCDLLKTVANNFKKLAVSLGRLFATILEIICRLVYPTVLSDVL